MTGTLTQSEFARLKGWNRGTVSRLKSAGRLVMAGDRVDVEASLALIEQTRAGRDDVTARNAAARAAQTAAPIPTHQPDEKNAPALDVDRLDSVAGDDISLTEVKRQILLLDLETRKREAKKQARELFTLAEVAAGFDDVIAFTRAGIENQPNRIAADLVGKDHPTITRLLQEDAQRIMSDQHREITRQLDNLAKGE
jgi:hypothetical protein